MTLPDSYKWWLENYSGGSIYSDEIYSLYESGLDEGFSGGDLCHMHAINKQNGLLENDNKMIFHEASEGHEIFFFKTEDSVEWPVYISNDSLKTEKLYSNTFSGFLEKWLNDLEY